MEDLVSFSGREKGTARRELVLLSIGWRIAKSASNQGINYFHVINTANKGWFSRSTDNKWWRKKAMKTQDAMQRRDFALGLERQVASSSSHRNIHLSYKGFLYIYYICFYFESVLKYYYRIIIIFYVVILYY